MSWLLVVRGVPIVGVIAGAGCAQIAGIDETTGNGRPVDSLAITRVSLGATVESNPLDLTGLNATYFVGRASAGEFDRIPATVANPGKWTSKIYAPAAVQFTLPDVPAPLLRLYELHTLSLQVPFFVLEHPNPSPAPDGATIGMMLHLDSDYTAADRFTVYTVGAWTSRAFAPTEILQAPGLNVRDLTSVTYAYNTSSILTGRSQLDKITAKDALLVLRYSGAALIGVAEATPFDQTGADLLTLQSVAVPQDQTLDVKITPASLATRYTAVRPAVSGLSMSWALLAAPGYKYAFQAGPTLQSGSLAMTDVGVMVKYGNPFTARQWNTMFVVGTSESRVYMPAGTMTPVTLSAGMAQYVEPPAAGTEMNLPAGLPIVITLDHTPLSTDGQTYKASTTQFPNVTFVVDAPVGGLAARPTIYNLAIYDLVPNQAGTALDRHLTLFATSRDVSNRDASFDLPPETFQAGHSYTMRAFATLGGFPGLDAGDSGDLATRGLPLAQSYLDSAVFTVTP